ncbi:MAG TPA: carboxypeptidase regulatory-like domain-containing protein, partial [Bryobacteraceae bacterium]|nr:carboxypeptidase regulatory-like domain-containing protein [Bryobacteraceae bacterium]
MKRILLLAIVCSCAASLRAQSIAGSGVVSGWVLEREDEGMPDAEVILENPGMGVRRVIVTSLDGVFEAVGLAPAPGYRLSIRHKNFQDWQSKEFEVLAGQRVTFRLIMQPASGGAAETPNTGLPLVNQTPDSVGTVTNADQVNLLPVSKRRWEDLVLLAPAVTTSWPLGTAAVRADSSSNPYFTDGLLTSNTYSGKRAAPAGRIAEDAVQGFQVVTAAAPVEFGHGMGGVINTVTRSGGNGLHGSLYEYFSNDSMTAIDRYALGQSLFQKRNQMGFNLGGVVPKSKLFFFSNLEIEDSHGQGLNRITNPLLVNDGGTLPAVWNCHATSAQCAVASSFLQSQMNVLVPRSEHWITGLARLDYRRSDRHTLSLAVHGAHSRAPQGFDNEAVAPDGGMLGNSLTRQDTHWARLEWTSAPSPNSSNELRFGLFHDRISNSASDSGLATGTASIVVAGVPLGEGHPDPGILRERRTQLVDNLRASKGRHTFLVGVDWTRTRDWLDSLANGSGTYYYSSLTAFAQDLAGGLGNNYTLYTQTLGNPIRNLPSSEIGFYAQDTWKA